MKKYIAIGVLIMSILFFIYEEKQVVGIYRDGCRSNSYILYELDEKLII